ncbi:MAG: hypothetical protein Crog4KO_05840 [Crocinitomicaceae bacterium]
MSTIETYQKIPKNVASEDDLDFAFLRRTGIAYIESMGGELWTDLNDHDPGVTMLEMLAYAITDLGARLDLPIETILASEDDPELRRQFYRAEEILPSCPVNELDYRKLFIDIDGVRNCWMLPAEKLLHVDCVNEMLAYEAFPEEILEQSTCALQGLNCLIVDYEENAIKDDVNELIMEAYHANRNLCEDLVEIKAVKEQPISVCASMELERDADENWVHAQIIDAIEQYFASDIRRYSLKEMKEKGYRMDEIFEGPLLENGFIDSAELEEAGLRSEVRLSDIINLIMDIDGIISITNIQIKCCCDSEETGSDWLICLDPFCKPVLAPRPEANDPQGECELESVFNYKKDVLPVVYNITLVEEALDAIQAERAALNALALLDRFPEIPQGDVLDIGETTTIMNDFPETYGIGLYGLPGTVPESRRAQAKQLKGYLLFFDQILATYFAHLGKVKDLFAMDAGNAPTYFTQAIKDVRGFDEIVEDYPQADDPLLSEKLVEFLDENVARRNEILNHLLARFAENFSDYAFILKQMFDANVAEEQLVVSKELFLSEYIQLSSRRGKGYNCQGEVWDTENVSGVQHRVSRLSGIEDYSRRDLMDLNLDWLTFSGGEYTWAINDVSNTYITSADGREDKCQAIKESLRTIDSLREMDKDELDLMASSGDIEIGTEFGNAIFVETSVGSGEYTYHIYFDGQHIATGFDVYTELEDAAYELVDAIDYAQSQAAIDRFVLPIPEEGMFLVEHLFLLPPESVVTTVEESLSDGDSETDLPWPFLPICIEDCEDKCGIDPYSFRASVVIPGTAERFDNADFRNFLDNLIRREMPSHVLPRICFIDPCQLEEFQIRYEAFLQEKKDGNVIESTLNAFLEIFNKLQNIYPGGRLFDCNSTDVSGSIILGRSNI